MFKNLVSSWAQWAGKPRLVRDAEGDPSERRVWLRVPCDVQALCQPASEGDNVRFTAQIQNISRGGINLLANRPLEQGSLLSVELPGEDAQSTSQVLAYVIHVNPLEDGRCALGCNFATELRDEELRPFEVRRIRPIAPDPRRWVRFPSNAQVTFHAANASEADAKTVQIVDISPGGISFQLPSKIEMGTMLSLQFRGSDGQAHVTILGSVVRCVTGGRPDWLIGCNFIRDLTEEELTAVS
jgi:hypothetical protein